MRLHCEFSTLVARTDLDDYIKEWKRFEGGAIP
jgi:hypothetical protein